MSDKKVETIEEVIAAMRRFADIVNAGPDPLGKDISDLLREYADRIEAAVKREREETKDYFAKLHDGPSMICTAKNCSLRNAAEDIVEQVKAEASFWHFAPVVVEDRPVGNAAAMREALMKCNEYFRCDDDNRPLLCNLARKADEATQAALAAPARNCDRFATAEEAYAAWMKDNSLTAICDWLFAPTEGGRE